MGTPLEEYQEFVDSLVRRRESVEARRVREGVWHKEPHPDQARDSELLTSVLQEQVKYNELLAGLSQDQRELIAEIVQHARDSSFHDVLVLMTDKDYRLTRNGVELAFEPYGTPSFYDFVARRDGTPWPTKTLSAEAEESQ